MCLSVRFFFVGLVLLTPVVAPAAADPYEMINLYDAFGRGETGVQKDFGFSVLIRYEGKTILFDSGTSADILEQNTKALGIDLSEVDFAVASHAHSDHIGGFDYLLRVNPKVKIYFPSDFFGAGGPMTLNIAGQEPEVVEELPEEQRYFDGKTTSARLQSNGRFYKVVEYVDRNKEIAPGIHLIATTSPYIGYFTKYPGVDLEGNPIPKMGEANFLGLPELSLSLSTKRGELLVVGCSHSTVETIVRETKQVLNKDVYFLAGGYHLLPYDRKTIEGIATRLQKLGVKKVAPAHCTGHLAFNILQDVYGEDYELFGLGSRLLVGSNARTGVGERTNVKAAR